MSNADLQRQFAAACGLPIREAAVPTTGPVSSPASKALAAYYEQVPCPTCYGEGWPFATTRCHDCDGSGRVPREASAGNPVLPMNEVLEGVSALAGHFAQRDATHTWRSYAMPRSERLELRDRCVELLHALRLHADAVEAREIASADREQQLVGDIGVLRAEVERLERELQRARRAG